MRKQYIQPASTAVQFTPATLLAESGGTHSPYLTGTAAGGSGSSLIWGGSTSDKENKDINWNPD